MNKVLCVFLLAASAFVVNAAEDAPDAGLRVGVFEKAPYVVKEDGGAWNGLAVDLWRLITSRRSLNYNFIEVDQSTAVQALQNGEIDVLLGQMSVSAEHERVIDYTHAFLVEPLAAALDEHTLFPHWIEFLQTLPNHGVFSVLIAGAIGLVIFAVLMWIAERRTENSHFKGRPIHALGSALWFSAVTMTAVGYGDKTPITPLGRFFAFIWMFLGILMVSGFIATVASTVAASRTAMAVFQLGDIARFQNGVLQGSSAGIQLRNAGIPAKTFINVDDALAAVKDESIHAFVADFVTIRYELNQSRWQRLRAAVLHDTSTRMAIPVREGLPELGTINIGLLDTLDDPAWQGVLRRWTGVPMVTQM